MIDEIIMDKICPVPDEEGEMERIRKELDEEGFAINNFNKGGIFYTIIRIFVTISIELKNLAREIINNSFVRHAEEDWLEIKAADYGKSRKEATKTQGYVTIYRDDFENALQVTRGHMFKTLPDVNGKELKFYCLEETVIDAGEQTGKVLVEAEQAGTAYNIEPGRIVSSMIHLEGVSHVANEKGWLYSEGADIEELEAFRERILESWSEVAELTTEEKLKSVANKVSGVLDVKVDAQHPRGQGTTDIIITGTNGEATQELLRRVEEATRYLKNNYDDFLYKSAVIVHQDLEVKIYIAENEATADVEETALNVIREAMQLSRRADLNCIYRDDIRYVLKKAIPSYKRAVFLNPENDIELQKDKVVMLDTLKVQVFNVGGEQIYV